MRRAVFLDRDGTIVKQIEFVTKPNQLRLLPGAAKAIAAIGRLGYLLFIVTNQPVVARGMVSEEGVHKIHAELLRRLARHGVRVHGVYFCPHHPNADVKKYRIVCACRKPRAGMLRAAAKKFGVDLRKSFMVGDHAWDIMAGKAARAKTILVHTSARSRDPAFAHVKPDFEAQNLREAVSIIKKHGK